MTETITDTTEIVDTKDVVDEKEISEVDDLQQQADVDHTGETDTETFPRDYVEKLRKEAADNRVKAKRAEALQREVFALRVAALGKLHDAADMPFDPDLLDDADRLAQAVDELAARKPYLARRTPKGDVGQGATATTPTVSIVDLLRGA